MRFRSLLLISFLATCGSALGIPLVQYNFTGNTSWNQWDARFRDPSVVAEGLTATRINRPDKTGTFDFGHFIQPGVGGLGDRYLASWGWYPGGKFYDFSVSVGSGYVLDLDSISFLASTNLPAGNSMSLSISYADNAAFAGAISMGSFNVFSTLPITNPFVSFTASNNSITNGTGTYFFRIANTAPAIRSAISYGLYLDSISLNGRISAPAVPDNSVVAWLLLPALGGLAALGRRGRHAGVSAIG
jgi:hypothetical protein